MNKKDYFNKSIFLIFSMILLILLFIPFNYKNQSEVSYSDFLTMVNNKQIKTIDIDLTNDTFSFEDTNDNVYITKNPKYDNFKKEMLEKGIEVEEISATKFSDLLSLFINIAFIGVLVYSIIRMSKMMNSTNGVIKKKNIKPFTQKKKITFDNVAGLAEVKKDLISIVDFLKNPELYKEAGAKLPKGVILYGPPGTGKTLLAKAIAGEANVPFFSANGSDFIEKFVGVGAQRVRQLFETAKKSAPCILFIDELDSIGASRNDLNGTSEHRQTINALLGELDGFNGSENVLVIGATNRLEDLDKALIRPGRFDNLIAVPIPCTASERKEVIDMYTEGKKFAEDIDFENISKETLGFSPADIESLINDAALISVQKRKKFIDRECIDSAMYKKILKGHQKEDPERDEEEIRLVAWHEAGHAIMGCYFDADIPKVTIVQSTSGAGGVTFFNQKKLGLYSIEELEQQIMISYGGRCAEYLLLGDKNKVTTGAQSDIKNATEIIYEMITDYGMTTEYGMLNLKDLHIDNKAILSLASKKANELEAKTLKILEKNYNKLKIVAESLIEKETILGNELEELYSISNY